MSDLTLAVKKIGDAAPAYEKAKEFYFGEQTEVFASAKLRKLLGESADEYKVNLAKKPVNAVLNGLKIMAVTVPGNEDGKANEALTKVLQNEVWKPNELDMYVPDWLREIGYQGDSYLIVWDGEEDGTVEVHLCKALYGRMFYEQENPRKKRFFAMVWREGDPEVTRVTLWYHDRIERYWSNIKNPKSDKDFKRYTEDDSTAWPQPNPYGEIPVFHGRNDHPYGIPDHFDAYGPQNAITKLLATSMASVDFQGFPIRAALMGDSLDDENDWDADDNESIGGTGIEQSGHSKLKAHPGQLWQLYNVNELVQLDPPNPDGFLKPLDKSMQLMSVATETPMRFFTGNHGNAPSGESLREEDKPLTNKREARQMAAGSALSDALTFAMRKVLGKADCPEVSIQWAPIERATAKEEWETVKAKQEAGVPRDVSLQEAGYTSDQTDEWGKNQADPEGTLAARVGLLNTLGEATQKLATAASLGAVDMALVQELVAGFLPDNEDAPSADPDAPPAPRPLSVKEQAEIVQKTYLGVPGILSREEARAMLRRAGIEISTDDDPEV